MESGVQVSMSGVGSGDGAEKEDGIDEFRLTVLG